MKRKRMKARDYGDNPKVRHSHREHERIDVREPWERQYAGIKKKSTRVSPHYRKVKGRKTRVRVKSHVRRFR
jgi:hypothetical protein